MKNTNWVRIKGQGLGRHEGEVNLRTSLDNLTIFDKYEAVEEAIGELQEGQIVVSLNQGELAMLIITSYVESPDLKELS